MSSRKFNAVLAPGASRFRLKVRRSKIHRVGVFAAQVIPPNRRVIEYTGDRISMREAMSRLKKIWGRRGPKHLYIFQVGRNRCIDGSVGGGGGQWINHSYEPNLAGRMIRGHLLFFSARRIRSGEELSLDYRFPSDSRTIRCKCGSPNCRGTINLK